MNYINASDKNGEEVNLYYEDLGAGKPVVLIHGWPLSHVMWEYQVSELVNAGFRCISYDRRGFGKSSRPLNGYDYDTLADDLKAIIDGLGLTDITLVGFSMGGGEVVRYFTSHQGTGVTKAVLISSVTPFMLKTDDNPNGVDGSVFDDMMKKMKEDRIAFLDGFGKDFYGVGMLSSPVIDPYLQNDRNVAAEASPIATMKCAVSFSHTDFRNEMASVTVPVLLIHGDADKTVPKDASAEEACKLLPDCIYKIYTGHPHGLYYTDKEQLNGDLISFIS